MFLNEEMGTELKQTSNNGTQFFSDYLQIIHFDMPSKTNFNDLPVYNVIESSN